MPYADYDWPFFEYAMTAEDRLHELETQPDADRQALAAEAQAYATLALAYATADPSRFREMHSKYRKYQRDLKAGA